MSDIATELPPLAAWEDTADTVHMQAQIVGEIGVNREFGQNRTLKFSCRP